MFSSSICLQELYLSSPSLKNLQSTSMLYIYGLNNSFIFKAFHLLLNIYNCRYDWDAATAANFLRQHGLIGAPSRLGKFPYIPHWDNMKFHLNIFYLFLSLCSTGEFKLNIECNHATLAGHRFVFHSFVAFKYYEQDLIFKLHIVAAIMNSRLLGLMACLETSMQIRAILKLVFNEPLWRMTLVNCKF